MPSTSSLSRVGRIALPAIAGLYLATCTVVTGTATLPRAADVAQLWERPDDLFTRDLVNGPWGERRAPDSGATYTFIYVAWACDLVGGLSDRQWADAFRAGGDAPPIAERFIRRLQHRIAQGKAIGSAQ